MAILVILLFLPLFFYFFLIQKHRNARSPPGPRGLPIIGNLHQFDGLNPHLYFWKLSKTYGPIMSYRLGFKPTLIISSAKMAKEVFKTHDIEFSSRPSLICQQRLSYKGLAFSPYDDNWREMRKITVVHLFNSNKVQDSRPIREDEVSRLIEKISKSVCKPIDFSEKMMFLANTITARIAFGNIYEEEATERSRFHELLNEVQALLATFFFSDYFPFMGWYDKLSGRIARLEKIFKEFDAFYQNLIVEHLDPNRSKPEQEDIIDVLLRISKQRGSKVDLTWDNIKAVVMNVFVGGTDTVAATMVWAMTYLMKNPTEMSKVQEEIRHKIGNKGFVDADDIERLTYLKAVVKETLRLQPVDPLLIPRETTKQCIIDGYEIPAKTLVYVNALAIGRDPESWPDKTEEFYPKRFIDSSIDLKGNHFELIPFGSGRRVCPGIYMGLATVELALANLLYKFDWEMPSGIKKEDLDFDALPGLTMHKKNALVIMARKRQFDE